MTKVEIMLELTMVQSENGGFSDHTLWLGVNKNYQEIHVEDQEVTPTSILNFYRELIAPQEESSPCLWGL